MIFSEVTAIVAHSLQERVCVPDSLIAWENVGDGLWRQTGPRLGKQRLCHRGFHATMAGIRGNFNAGGRHPDLWEAGSAVLAPLGFES